MTGALCVLTLTQEIRGQGAGQPLLWAGPILSGLILWDFPPGPDERVLTGGSPTLPKKTSSVGPREQVCVWGAAKQRPVGSCKPEKTHFFKIPELMLNIPRDVSNDYKSSPCLSLSRQIGPNPQMVSNPYLLTPASVTVAVRNVNTRGPSPMPERQQALRSHYCS